MNRPTRRDMMRAGLAGLGSLAVPAASSAGGVGPGEFSFHADHVLGTSLDVFGRSADAGAVESALLGEVERLRRVFSTYDPDSELSRLNRADGPFVASADLIAVLREYGAWHRCAPGALSANLGDLVAAWADAGRTGVEPDAATLARLADRAGRPGFVFERGGVVVRSTGTALNLNSVAKGYVILKAVAAAARRPPISTDCSSISAATCGPAAHGASASRTRTSRSTTPGR